MAKSKRDGTAQQKSYDASKRGGLLLTQTRLQQPSNPAEAEATGTARSARFKKTRRRALDPKAKGKPAAAGEVAAHGIKQLKVTDEAGAGKVAEAGSAVVKAMTESSSKRLRERGGGSTEGNGGSKRGALAEAKQAEGGNTVGCGRREAAGMGGRRDGEKAPSVLIERGGVAVSGEAAAPGAGKKVDVAFKASCGTKEAQTTDEAGNDDEGAEENMRWRLPPPTEDVRVFNAPRGKGDTAARSKPAPPCPVAASGLGRILQSSPQMSDIRHQVLEKLPSAHVKRVSRGSQTAHTPPPSNSTTEGHTLALVAAQAMEIHDNKLKQLQLQYSIKAEELAADGEARLRLALEAQRKELDDRHATQVRILSDQSLRITADLEDRVRHLDSQVVSLAHADAVVRRMTRCQEASAVRAFEIAEQLQSMLALLDSSVMYP